MIEIIIHPNSPYSKRVVIPLSDDWVKNDEEDTFSNDDSPEYEY